MIDAPDNIESFERAVADLLIANGRLDERGLERAMRVRAGSQERIPQLLSKLGLVSERDVAEAIARQLGLPVVAGGDYPTVPLLEDKVSLRFLSESLVLPIAEEADAIVLAMADPLSQYAIDAIRLITGRKVTPRVAVPGELEAAIERLYGKHKRAIAAEAAGESTDAVELDVERLKDLASEAPVIRLVNQFITRAVESRASDIHLEPFEDRLRVRYRIDGSLRDVESPPARFRAAIVSRVKIMARLNIAERRLPQDGRIKLAIRGTPIDFRISITPTMHGESVVIRVLDRTSVALDFAALGMSGDELSTYLGILERPNGILLATGPTGSGKTTTLYTSLLKLNSPEKKIVTIEDPIEYQLEGINQIQVKPNIGLDFANILRSVLRHDPDIIMVGEIRDVETAKIAVQAALTGHLVLSTLHTNNAASSISRLLDMGVEDYLLTSTLNGIVAQRLVRTLCRKCRQPYLPLPELVEQLGLRRRSSTPDLMLFGPKGCDECNGTGYFGRTSIGETLVVRDSIRRLILRHAESHELHRAAVQEGMRAMYDDGLGKALAGVTTIEEVLQVTRDVHDDVGGGDPIGAQIAPAGPTTAAARAGGAVAAPLDGRLGHEMLQIAGNLLHEPGGM
jgi:general secretion pathway protein E